ncbi:unnamed protein product [Heterobilharzia americana]|nr:unnamed protein product [Heterobilharzia americana]
MNKTEYVKVDYYESMKETHWDPIFRGLTQRLSNRLTEICYSRTNLPNDLWLFAKLEKIQLKNDINRETNCNLSINNNGTYSQIHLFLKRLGTNITAELESTHSTQVRVQNNGPLLNAKPKASYVSKAYMHIKQATQQTSNCLSTSQNSLLLSPSVSQLIPVQPSHYFRSNPFAQSLQNMPSISISHSPLKLDIIQLNDILLLLSNHMKLAPTILNPLAYTNTQVNNDLLTLSNILILNNLCTISNSALSTHPFIIATRTERQNHRNSYVLLPCLDYQHPFIETPNIMMCKNLLHANYLPQQNSKKLLVTPFNIFSYILNDQSNVFENILPTTSNNFWNNSHLESDFPINSMSVNFIPNNTSKITNLSKIISNHNCIIYSTPFPQLATVNVMSPNLTTVEQLNLSLKSQPIPDIGQYHLDILFVQDEAKTRFMCTVSNKK